MPFITEQYSKIHPVSMEQFNALQALTVGLLVVLLILVFIVSMVFIRMQKQIDSLQYKLHKECKYSAELGSKIDLAIVDYNLLSNQDLPELRTKVVRTQDSLSKSVVALSDRISKLEDKQNDK